MGYQLGRSVRYGSLAISLSLLALGFQNCGQSFENKPGEQGSAESLSSDPTTDPLIGSGTASVATGTMGSTVTVPFQLQNLWRALPQSPVPTARSSAASTWIGDRLFMWSGWPGSGSSVLNEGSIYNPSTGTWQPVSTTDAFYPSSGARAVWTGSRVIVWGGLIPIPYTETNGNTTLTSPSSAGNVGSVYDPVMNRWTPFEQINPPAGRSFHAMVWFQDKMFVWGGYQISLGVIQRGDGAIYESSTKTWRPVSNTGAPSARQWVNAVWTGTKIFLFGGCVPYSNELFSYDPAIDRWEKIDNATGTPPSPRCGNSMVWTGQEIIIAGGYTQGATTSFTSAAAYNPTTNSWRQLPDFPGAGRSEHIGVWTGRSMILWGGYTQNSGRAGLNTGVELY